MQGGQRTSDGTLTSGDVPILEGGRRCPGPTALTDLWRLTLGSSYSRGFESALQDPA